MIWRPIALSLCLAGCGPSAIGQVALRGELPELRRGIVALQKSGELQEEQVRELALSVAQREIASARGSAGVARVRELRTCIAPMVSHLRQRATKGDVVAAAATMALLESGHAESAELVLRYATDSRAEWRSVAGRAALGPSRSALRQRLFVDGDQRVRRAALHAAFARPASSDERALLEVARLDPDPLSRSLALQTLGTLGGATIVSALRDQWPRASARTRQAIVGAWSKPKSISAGGLEQLLWVMGRQRGLPQVVAARSLIVSADPTAAVHKEVAIDRLKQIAKEGAGAERKLALALLPITDTTLSVFEDVAESESPLASVSALGRLLELPKSEASARKKLHSLLKTGSAATKRVVQRVLVAARDPRVTSLVIRELHHKDTDLRKEAALALLSLGEFSKSATALADRVAAVRTELACAILASSD